MQLSEGIEDNKKMFYPQHLTFYNGSNLQHLCMLLRSTNNTATPLCTGYNLIFVVIDFGLFQSDVGLV